MPHETVRYEVDGSILTITLNRQDKLNAFTTQMLHEINGPQDYYGPPPAYCPPLGY